ncbi:MAG: SBBP repeat-containing protein [Owenweeksia sp.]|nr:SBBP repeat-containing protein [Owenweeksia sp.]
MGDFSGTVDFDPSASTANLVYAGASDIFLAKYDAAGNYLWAKRLGGSFTEAGQSVAIDGSGNVVVTGFFYGTADFDPSASTANLVPSGSSGNSDIFLAKYDASGNYLWAINMGGSSGDKGYSVAIDVSGNALVTGYFVGTVDFDPSATTANLVSSGSADIFLAKYDAAGNYLWAINMGGNSSDVSNSVAADASGNAVVTGRFQGTADFDPSASMANLVSAGASDIFLAKYDASGNYLWAHSMGGSSTDIGQSVAIDGSGNAFVTGYFGGTVDFDPSANTANLVSAGNADIFLAKYDGSGNYLTAINMGGSSFDIGYSVAIDGSGNAVVTGYFNGTADFDPSPTTANLVSAGQYDIFLASYTNAMLVTPCRDTVYVNDNSTAGECVHQCHWQRCQPGHSQCPACHYQQSPVHSL